MPSNAEIWAKLDSLASHYELHHRQAANQLYIGSAVAQMLEPDHGRHPLHTRWERTVRPRDGHTGAWFPLRPMREQRWWDQWLRERMCKKNGGHWWHPADPMIEWFCCRCGKDRDGTPQDGT